MNLVIVYGEIITNIDFRFIYDRYMERKEKHTSIAKCKLRLSDGNEVKVYGYEDIADRMFRFYQRGSKVLIEGSLDQSMKINIDIIQYKEFTNGVRYLFEEDLIKGIKKV